jgi:hypothetical protein
VDLATRQVEKAMQRDDAVQRLRDLTLTVAIAALGAVGLLAWMSAATFPGQAGSIQPGGQATSAGSANASNGSGDDLQPASAAPAGSGSGLAVSGASR